MPGWDSRIRPEGRFEVPHRKSSWRLLNTIMTTGNRGRILVVDDQPDSFRGLSTILSADGYDIIQSGTAEHASEILASDDFDAVIAEVGLSDGDGMGPFEYISAARPDIPVILLTTYETMELALEAMGRGAFYYFVKPPEYPKLRGILSRAMEQRMLRREIELLKDRLYEMTPFNRIIGNTASMRKTIEITEAVKESPGNILIIGEPGTGKELLARTLHYGGSRSASPFIPIKCAAMPMEFMEVELFGRRDGHNGDNSAARRGKLEEAGNGIVFLEEIEQLAPPTQARLLQLLEDGYMEKSDCNGRVDVQFRLISTSTDDIREVVRIKTFSRELYRRISEIEIKVPPLRERRDDIPLLAAAFLEEFCLKQRKRISLSSEVMRAFQHHDWPGNVRQLRDVVERGVALAHGKKITLGELPDEFVVPKKRTSSHGPMKTLKELEMQAITEALRKCNGNKSRTARMLGISRKAFYKRLREAEHFRSS